MFFRSGRAVKKLSLCWEKNGCKHYCGQSYFCLELCLSEVAERQRRCAIETDSCFSNRGQTTETDRYALSKVQ